MEPDKSGQSYQSGYNARQENEIVGRRGPNNSPGSNPFREAQNLCHTFAAPSFTASTNINPDPNPEEPAQ